MHPVAEGMILGESLFNGAVDLAFVALCNDVLAVRSDNEEIMHKLREKDRG